MMHEVAQVNPFGTEQFVWLDAGYIRKKREIPDGRPLVRNNFTANGVRRDQLVLHNIISQPEENNYEIAGGAWGATKEGLERAYDLYFKTFWHMVSINKPYHLCFPIHASPFLTLKPSTAL